MKKTHRKTKPIPSLFAKIERIVPEPKGSKRAALKRALEHASILTMILVAGCALLATGMRIGEGKCGPKDEGEKVLVPVG